MKKSNSNNPKPMKDKKQLEFVMKSNLEAYVDQLAYSADASAMNKEWDGYNETYMDLFLDDISTEDVLCMSDLYSQSPHLHLFEKEMNKEIKY